MAKLTRILQNIFGSSGDVSQFGQIGSQTAGSPLNTKALDTIQALTQYVNGLYSITANGAQPPYIEDLNSLYLLITSQLKYLFQNGVPEYIATEPYYNLISFVQVAGVIYQSIDGTDGTPNTGNAPASSPTKWRNIDPFQTASSQVENAVTETGLTFDPTDAYCLSRSQIADSHMVGESLYMDIPLTQVTVANSKSTANPSFPRYCPVIARNVDKVITTAQSLTLVNALRATVLSVLGTASFSGTVSGSTITFANTTILNALLAAIQNEGLVRRWLVTQDANFAASGALYSGGPAAMTINVAGTDYVITAVSTGGHTIDVTGTPTAGAQTCIVYPYRIAGSTTTAQLPQLSGFVPVGSDDYDGYNIGGYRSMDRGVDHRHDSPVYSPANPFGAGVTNTQGVATGGSSASSTSGSTPTSSGAAIRLGKTTDARSSNKFVYTWAGVLLTAA